MLQEHTKTFVGDERFLTHVFKQSKTLAYGKYDTVLSLLLVVFHNGSEYEYHGVDKTVWDELTCSVSAGAYFSRVLRNYKFVRIK